MENIGNFLDACVAYGVPKADLFQTVDLYEGQNIPQVCVCVCTHCLQCSTWSPTMYKCVAKTIGDLLPLVFQWYSDIGRGTTVHCIPQCVGKLRTVWRECSLLVWCSGSIVRLHCKQ